MKGVTIRVPRDIRNTPVLSPFEKLVYCHILQLVERGISNPRIEDLHAAIGRSYKAVHTGLRTLEQFGLIRKWLASYEIPPVPTWLEDTVKSESPEDILLDVLQPTPIPYVRDDVNMNRQVSVGGERAVAQLLRTCGWRVGYRGSHLGAGYDLDASLDYLRARVEVKSSAKDPVRYAVMSNIEWRAAERFGDAYFLALVDEQGSPLESIWFVQNPRRISDSPKIRREVLRPHAFRAADLLAVMIDPSAGGSE